MKIALLQQNFLVGDLEGNARKIRDGYTRACERDADLVISSELSLLGYPPRDLLEHKDITRRQLKILEELAVSTGKTGLCVGIAEPNREKLGKPLFNSVALLLEGKIREMRRKALLPTYDVFDEYRYFEPHTRSQEPITFRDKKIGILICEDIWNGTEDPEGRRQYTMDPVREAMRFEPDFLVVPNGSPYWWGKGDRRFRLVRDIVTKYNVPLFYINQVGGNDELIFDGRSFAMDAKGRCVGAGKSFEEDTVLIDIEKPVPASYAQDTENLLEVEKAIVVGVRDYIEKVKGFPGGAVIGLSGGIDSAITAVLATRAVGKDQVMGVAMPSLYSSKASVEDAEHLAKNLGITFQIIPINPGFEAFREMLEGAIGWNDPPQDTTEENIQARIRGMILMAIANRERRIVLGTGNKSEFAVGYATLYGDMASGLGVISDLPKTLVYRLAEFLNKDKEVIPRRTIEKAPSAELRPDQKDTDSLPPYEILDKILESYIEERRGPEEIIAKGFEKDLVERVVQMVNRAEFKRRQMAPGLKVTTKAFGTGRRMPIAAKVY